MPLSESVRERYGFIWYSDSEIFDYDDAKLDEIAKKYHDLGYTILITFSGTHFRWSFSPWWDDITDYLRRFAKACHKYGIRLVEHHSCHLNFAANSPEQLETVLHRIRMRGLRPEKWTSFSDYVCGDPLVDGVPISSMRAINGATGEPFLTQYMAYGMCFNNPDFRRIYFNYLETLYKAGIDGIMTDDVQYAASTCTCPHCRKLFREKTGYDLPDPTHWEEFDGDYDNPIYIAWRRFRQWSTDEFQFAVNQHFESLGYTMLRPNYICTGLIANPTAYTFDNTRALWTNIFQENFVNAIPQQAWLGFAREAVHRTALAERAGVDAMSLFYPNSSHNMYFSWALSHHWGHMLLTTLLGNADLTELERPYRAFDRAYPHLFDTPIKFEDAAFWFSTSTRDYTADAVNRFMKPLAHLMEAAILSGIHCGMVFEWDTAEELLKHPIIVLPCVGMVSAQAMDNLYIYAKNGGKLIITGDFARYRADGSERSAIEIETFLAETNAIYLPNYKNNVQQAGAISERKNTINPIPAKAPACMVFYLRETGGSLLKSYINPRVVTSNPDVIPALFATATAYTLHLTNIADTIALEGATISHFDDIKHFMPWAKKLSALTVTVNTAGIGHFTQATLYTPEQKLPIIIPMRKDCNTITLSVPTETFSGYAAIELK